MKSSQRGKKKIILRPKWNFRTTIDQKFFSYMKLLPQ